MAELTVGAKAPEFTLEGEDGVVFRLSDYAGKKLVLYFYPKDDTSGCTKQAIGFTDQKAAFDAVDTEILGVSKDSVKRHAKFRDKHSLGIALGADEDAKVIEAYGVWVEKKLYGRTYMGIERATFLIDRDGKIAQVWRKVKVPGHIDAVLKAAQDLD